MESWYNWINPGNSADTHKVSSWTQYDKTGRVLSTHRVIDDDYDNAIPLSETEYNEIGKPRKTTDENQVVTKYWYDEAGNLVETEVYAVYDEVTPSNNVLLTTTRTLFDAEGRAMVTVGPYVPGEQPVGTETVYDALGRVVEARRWRNVEIHLSAFAVDDEGHVIAASQAYPAIGKNATGWTSNGVISSDPAAELLSSTTTDYDVAGRVYHSYAPTQATTGIGTCTQEIHYDAAG